MAQPEHHDPIQDNIDTHPVKLAIGVGVGAISLVIGIILMAQFAIGAYGSRSLKDEPAMAPKAVAKRIAPVAKLETDPNAPPPAAAAAPAPVAAVAVPAAAAKAADGKAIYDATCGACHGTGVAGAPKVGDKAAWAPRLKGGKDALYASAAKGKGAMPPKGGASISEGELKAAVDFMLAGSK